MMVLTCCVLKVVLMLLCADGDMMLLCADGGTDVVVC